MAGLVATGALLPVSQAYAKPGNWGASANCTDSYSGGSLVTDRENYSMNDNAEDSIVIGCRLNGRDSTVGELGQVVIGNFSLSKGEQTSILGYASAAAAQATAIGANVFARGSSSIAMGSDDLLGDKQAYANEKYFKEYAVRLPESTLETIYGDLWKNSWFYNNKAGFDNVYGGDKRIYSPTYAAKRGAIGSRTVAGGTLSTSVGSLSFALADKSTAMGLQAFVAGPKDGINFSEEEWMKSYQNNDFNTRVRNMDRAWSTLNNTEKAAFGNDENKFYTLRDIIRNEDATGLPDSRRGAVGATAIGEQSRVYAANSVAVGNRTEAGATGSFAYGYNAKAVGEGSLAVGYGSIAAAQLDSTAYQNLNALLTWMHDTNQLILRDGEKNPESDFQTGIQGSLAALKDLFNNKSVDFNARLRALIANKYGLSETNAQQKAAIDKIVAYIKTYTDNEMGGAGKGYTGGTTSDLFSYNDTEYLTIGDQKIKSIKVNTTDSGASVENALAIGRYAFALDNNTISMGFAAVSDAESAIVLGSYAHATNKAKDSLAIGVNSYADAKSSLALGYSSNVFSEGGMAIGLGALVGSEKKLYNPLTGELLRTAYVGSEATDAAAIGKAALAAAKNSMALGNFAQANLSNSMALGVSSKTDYKPEDLEKADWVAEGAVAIPTSTTTGVISVGAINSERRIVNVASGYADSDAVNVAQLKTVDERITSLTGNAGNGSLYQFLSVEKDPSKNDKSIGEGGKITKAIQLESDYKKYVELKKQYVGFKIREQFNGEAINATSLQAIKDKFDELDNQNGGKLSAKATLLKNLLDEVTAATKEKNTAKYEEYVQKLAVAYDGKQDPDDPTKWIDGDNDKFVEKDAAALANLQKDTNYNNDGAKGADSIAIGYKAKTKITLFDNDSNLSVAEDGGRQAVAIGFETEANGRRSIALGSSGTVRNSVSDITATKADGLNAIAIGIATQATAADSIAIGRGALASGGDGIAIGWLAKASGESSIAQGDESVASGLRSIAIGLNAKATAENAIAIGSNANNVSDSAAQNLKDAVYLGANSAQVTNKRSRQFVTLGNGGAVTANPYGATKENAVDINGVKYYGFAGASPTSFVSIGGNSFARLLQGVAAGTISADSTDAINGSQLYRVVSTLQDNINTAVQNAGVNWLNINSTQDSPVPTTADNYNKEKTGALGKDSIAIGKNATAGAKDVADTSDNEARDNAVAIGLSAKATEASSVAIGSNSEAGAVHSDGPWTIDGRSAAALVGQDTAKIAELQKIAFEAANLFTSKNRTYENMSETEKNSPEGVALAKELLGDDLSGNTSGLKYEAKKARDAWDAAQADNSYNNRSVFAVGSAGNERQIQHVAAGVVSETSTDAINGSQLHATNTYLIKLAEKVGVGPINGVDGANGKDGVAVAGTPGTPGAQGAQGVPGDSGVNGENGTDGTPGLKGPAGRDGQDGTTLVNKVQSLRDGVAGTVVYTDTLGNRVLAENGVYYKADLVAGKVKANNGLWYDVAKVNPDGTLKDPNDTSGKSLAQLNEALDTANSKIVANKEVILSAVNPDGKTASPVTLGNLASVLGIDPTATTGDLALSSEPINKDKAIKAIGKFGSADETKLGLYGLKGAQLNRAVTAADLQALAVAGLTFEADNGADSSVHRALAQTLKILGTSDYITTTANSTDGSITIDLASKVKTTLTNINNTVNNIDNTYVKKADAPVVYVDKNNKRLTKTDGSYYADEDTAGKVYISDADKATYGVTEAGWYTKGGTDAAPTYTKANVTAADSVRLALVDENNKVDNGYIPLQNLEAYSDTTPTSGTVLENLAKEADDKVLHQAVAVKDLQLLANAVGTGPINGVDGRDGTDGNTVIGQPGVPGDNGTDGTDGLTGPAGKDGLNGTTVANKVQGLRDGVAGTLVYTYNNPSNPDDTKNGSRVLVENGKYYDKSIVSGKVKANDGLWYAAADVNADGSPKAGKTGQTLAQISGGHSLDLNNVILSAVNPDGQTTSPVTIANLQSNLDRTAAAGTTGAKTQSNTAVQGLLSNTKGLDRAVTLKDLQTLALAGITFGADSGTAQTVSLSRKLSLLGNDDIATKVEADGTTAGDAKISFSLNKLTDITDAESASQKVATTQAIYKAITGAKPDVSVEGGILTVSGDKTSNLTGNTFTVSLTKDNLKTALDDTYAAKDGGITFKANKVDSTTVSDRTVVLDNNVTYTVYTKADDTYQTGTRYFKKTDGTDNKYYYVAANGVMTAVPTTENVDTNFKVVKKYTHTYADAASTLKLGDKLNITGSGYIAVTYETDDSGNVKLENGVPTLKISVSDAVDEVLEKMNMGIRNSSIFAYKANSGTSSRNDEGESVTGGEAGRSVGGDVGFDFRGEYTGSVNSNVLVSIPSETESGTAGVINFSLSKDLIGMQSIGSGDRKDDDDASEARLSFYNKSGDNVAPAALRKNEKGETVAQPVIAANDVKLTGLKNGYIARGSSDAVTGDQIAKIVGINEGDHESLGDRITNLQNGLYGTVIYTAENGDRLLREETKDASGNVIDVKYYKADIVDIDHGYKAIDGKWYSNNDLNCTSDECTPKPGATAVSLAQINNIAKTSSVGDKEVLADKVVLSAIKAGKDGKTTTTITLGNIASVLGIDPTGTTGDLALSSTPIDLTKAKKAIGSPSGTTDAEKGLFGLSGANLNRVVTAADLQALAVTGINFKGRTGDANLPLGGTFNIYGDGDGVSGATDATADKYITTSIGNDGTMKIKLTDSAIDLIKNGAGGSGSSAYYGGEGVPVVYVDANGNELSRQADGKYYTANEIAGKVYVTQADIDAERVSTSVTNPGWYTQGAYAPVTPQEATRDHLALKDADDSTTKKISLKNVKENLTVKSYPTLTNVADTTTSGNPDADKQKVVDEAKKAYEADIKGNTSAPTWANADAVTQKTYLDAATADLNNQEIETTMKDLEKQQGNLNNAVAVKDLQVVALARRLTDNRVQDLATKVGDGAVNGIDGYGYDGATGQPGIPGQPGVPGVPGKDGQGNTLTGPAGQDGLNGTTIGNKVQGLRDGVAGTVVFTDKDGKRVLAENGKYYDTSVVGDKVKANDGLWYDKANLDSDGNVKKDASGNPVATGQTLAKLNEASKTAGTGDKSLTNDKVILSAVNPDGKTTSPVTIANLKDNLAGVTPTDAEVNQALSNLGLNPADVTPEQKASVKSKLAGKKASAEVASLLGIDGSTEAGKTQLSRAVTLHDLQTVAQAGLTFMGNDSSAVHRALGTTFKILGADLAYTRDDKPATNANATKAYKADYAADNLITHADGDDTVRIEMKKTPTFEGIVLDGKPGANGKDGYIGVDDNGNVVVKNGVDGLAGTDGKNGKDGASRVITEKDINGTGSVAVNLSYKAGTDTAAKTTTLNKGLTFNGDDNIETSTANDGVVNVKLKDKLTGITSITGPAGTDGNKTTITLGNKTVDVDGARITNIGTPTAGTDAANKDYVDTKVTNLTNTVNQGFNIATEGAKTSGVSSQQVKPANTVKVKDGVNTTVSKVQNEGSGVFSYTINVNGIPMSYINSDGETLAKVGDKFFVVTNTGEIDQSKTNTKIAGMKVVTPEDSNMTPEAKAKGLTIDNVGNGKVAENSKQAVNGGQIANILGIKSIDENGKVTGKDGTDGIGGTGKDTVNDAITKVYDIAKAKASNVTVKAGDNITVDEDIDSATQAKTYTVSMSKNIKLDSIQVGGVTINNQDTAQDPSIRDGANVLNVNGSGNSKGTVITGVADGQLPTDAVNVRQVNALANATNKAINNVNKRVDNLTKESRGGIAGAMATAGLQQTTQPGRTTVSVGTATFKGESAVALGFSKLSDNGKVGIRLSGMTTSNGDTGGSFSVGYTW